MTAEVIVALVGLVLQYGVQPMIDAIGVWGKEVITMEDIAELRSLVKRPEEY